MARAMSPKEHARIAAAVQAAEATTSGEIYCVVARTSGSYFFHAAFMVTLAIVIVSIAAAYVLHLKWYEVSAQMMAATQLAAIVAALAVLWLLPGIRIHFVPLGQRYRNAHDNAMRQFLGRNIHVTAARTGVLLFVSMTERYAEVVADAGINAKVPQETWDGVVAVLMKHAKRRQIAAGFIEAIGMVSGLLAEHFPVGAQDLNELDDHVVEI